MANPGISLRIEGDRELQAALLGLAVEIRERVIPAALQKAGAVVARRARQLAPEDESADPGGTLKKSIGLVVRRGRDKRSYVVIGARRGFARPVTRPIIIRGVFTGQASTRRADPANYAHLVEFGHFIVVPRKGTSIRKGNAVPSTGKAFVPAKPFLRPALAGAKEEVRSRLIYELGRAQAGYLNRRARRIGRSFGSALLSAA